MKIKKNNSKTLTTSPCRQTNSTHDIDLFFYFHFGNFQRQKEKSSRDESNSELPFKKPQSLKCFGVPYNNVINYVSKSLRVLTVDAVFILEHTNRTRPYET